MTDKEIIINGVDVAGCEAYMPKLGKGDCIALANNSASTCKGSPNCYYKQLQRKEQECEKWKSYYDLYRQNQETIKNIHRVVNSHPRYGVELTETGVIDKDERLSSLKLHEQIQLIFDETLQECEELKVQLNDMACMDNSISLCYPRQELKKEIYRYKQALEEIKR